MMSRYLKRVKCDTPSEMLICLMKDFYSTVPRAGESAMDYWIHLDKAINAADECLRRRVGRLRI